MKSNIDAAKEILFNRQGAYHKTFPQNLATEAVLEDLAKFCRADETTFHADQRVHAVLEGRREVWLRIQDHLKLKQDELWKKYSRKVSE